MSLAEDLLEQDERQEKLEEEIKENIEWMITEGDGDEYQCITIENLEGILSRFFGKKVTLKIK